jgi:hypothetical protein
MNEQQLERTAVAVPASALNLIFDGLFFFCFNTGGSQAINDPAGECRVGFLTTAPKHEINITGRQRVLVGDVGVTTSFDITLSHAEARSLQIELDVPGVSPPSVTRKGHHLPFNRFSNPSPPKDYFAWIIDLENREMHDEQLPRIARVLNPVLRINTGEFYTEMLSEEIYERTKVDMANTPFGQVAERTGVRIATLPQGKAFLKIGTSTLPLIAQPGATYEVTFKNRCPKCDVNTPEIKALELSDFPYYYHAFDAKILEQFNFKPIPPAAPPAICYVASGSRTTDI